ncbi:MAG: SDR family NAD(P)-dependent oxidoreductase, partial [Pirellulaceae bacterium]|nr:SDR family NAD(P)-dependent oxidoreductase [Pirellulaceae bacterium]
MSQELFDLSGKVAMVTGASRGLGEVAAKALATAGADVAVCGRNEADLARVCQDITAAGRRASGFSLDVLSGEAVRQGVERILEYFGHVDILVNNAGVNHRELAVDYPEEQWDRVIDT